MAHHAMPPAPEQVQGEQARSPRIPLRPDQRLQPLLTHDYGGFSEDSSPHGDFVIPASVTTPLIVKVADSPLRPPVFVNGPGGSYTRVEGVCAPGYLEVSLAPLGAYRVFGSAVDEISGSIVSLDELVGADARRLGERIQSAPTWEARARLLDAFLLDRCERGPEPSPEVSEAWDLLVQTGRQSTIREIAQAVGWSHKHLITKFKQQVGVTPRLEARLVRLSRVWRLIDTEQDWARIAAESGYADQPHLVREFRQFTGTTPTALITG